MPLGHVGAESTITELFDGSLQGFQLARQMPVVLGQVVVDVGGSDETVGPAANAVGVVDFPAPHLGHVSGLDHSHVHAHDVHVGQHLLGLMDGVGHGLGPAADPAVLTMFPPSPDAVFPLCEPDLLVRFRDVLGIGVAGDEPPPEAPDGALHDATVGIRVVVSQGSGLVRKDVQVMVDDHGAPGSFGGATRGRPASGETGDRQSGRSGQKTASIQILIHGSGSSWFFGFRYLVPSRNVTYHDGRPAASERAGTPGRQREGIHGRHRLRHFHHALSPPDKPRAQCHEEDLELIVRAEDLGFSEFWIGEHHTMKYENIVMPEIFIARALGETSRIRLGPAPVCLNQHHPAHVACRLAFLDDLSKGRLNLCFGPGSVPADQILYGAEPKNAAKMAAEATDIILKLWESDPPYEYDGEFWSIRLDDHVDEETGVGFIPSRSSGLIPPSRRRARAAIRGP